MSETLDLAELEAYLTGHWLTDLANFSAFLFQSIPDINWVGFYLSDGKKLRLGPFCGKPACTEIAFERGVCGRAFSTASILRVPNVDEFPGHISCDSASKSEMVFPLVISAQKVGVLDIDSPSLNRFSEEDQKVIEKALSILILKIEGGGRPFGRL